MERTTPLDAVHAQAGARWRTADGWRVPADFGDAGGEYAALRRGAGLLDLSLRGKLRVVGPDRVAFFDGMVSNDVRALRPGEGCNAFALDLRGKIRSGLHVLCDDDALWCDLDPGPAAEVQASLARHLVMEDARIEDMTGDWALVAVQGPGAAAALGACGIDTQSLTNALQHAPAVMAGARVRVVRCDHTGGGGFDLWVESEGAPAAWQELCTRGEARPVGMTALDVRRIEAGIPWYGSEIGPDRLPMEIGLEAGWISATKGCYVGQETIARVRFQGHVNRQLCGLTFAGEVPPLPGAELFLGEKRIGHVTSATTSPLLRHAVALALVHRDASEPGTELECDFAGERRPATVALLPFA